VHLALGGIRSPTGKRVLECRACHQPEAGGARMQPISMERHCTECHRLDFDPADPERQVPHGDAQAALTMLVEYYSAQYLKGYPDPLAVAVPNAELRRPGPRLTQEEREATLRRAHEKAMSVARDLFERRACTTCHTVERAMDARGGLAWKIAPVRLTAVWMPNARFDHARHGTALTRCETCHDAEHSRVASDVLMPGIAVCRTCHAGAEPPAIHQQLIASSCMSCHAFHRGTEPLWGAVRTMTPALK
jgi:predicted CXXCH cytochrome family protein